MNILYILGSGSKAENAELRYSLRSLERYLQGNHNIIVAGENPGFLSSEVQFHYIPEAKTNREYRIAAKICNAIKAANLYEDFIFLNDDFFFTQKFSPHNYPYYYKGCLSQARGSGDYNQALQDTFKYLQSQNLSTKHFDLHKPIIYNGTKFLAIENHWQASKESRFGFVVKSIYSNHYKIEGTKTNDVKLNQLKTYKEFERIYATHMFSCSDKGFFSGVEDFLQLEFPEKSKYESN